MPEIQLSIINQSGINSVNARELWKELGSGYQFADWIKSRLKESMAVEDVDFTRSENFERDNQLFKEKEYYLTIDKAIEICMLERTEKGMKIRQYFIREKKRLMELERKQEISIEEQTLNVINYLQKAIADQRHKVEFYAAVSESETNITFRDFGRLLGIGQNTLFQKCRELKLIDNQNSPYQKYIDAGYFKEIEKAFQKKEKTLLYKQTLITGKGQIYIEKKIRGGK